jgi:hypothetical protein
MFLSKIYASDHGSGEGHEAPPAAEHGEHAEEGHGGASTSRASSLPPWVEVEAKISTLEGSVRGKKFNIERLLEEKEHLKANDPRMKQVVDELTKEHKEMRKASEDLEKQQTILRYRFPERGADPKRKYEKVEIKSLKEMETNIGLDGRLQRAFKRAQHQYGSEEKVPLSQEPVPNIESTPKAKGTSKGTTSEEGSIILQK